RRLRARDARTDGDTAEQQCRSQRNMRLAPDAERAKTHRPAICFDCHVASLPRWRDQVVASNRAG
ncbi:hypothetical protein, partial [Rhodopseudomonas palustris]|uniref:hypothetical protein n=1 Tax=Rhodopseudomonas palustris TaxID=1076 RepID=UPI001AEC0FF6